MTATDDLIRLATLLTRPEADYLVQLEAARERMAPRRGHVARQLGMFADRLEDLSAEELGELFDETFERATLPDPARLPRDTARAAIDGGATREALRTIDRLMPLLEAERNPFAYLLRAACLLLSDAAAR